jgi:hypothetical protein
MPASEPLTPYASRTGSMSTSVGERICAGSSSVSGHSGTQIHFRHTALWPSHAQHDQVKLRTLLTRQRRCRRARGGTALGGRPKYGEMLRKTVRTKPRDEPPSLPLRVHCRASRHRWLTRRWRLRQVDWALMSSQRYGHQGSMRQQPAPPVFAREDR